MCIRDSAKTARCYMCAEPLNASSSWVSLVGDHPDGVFCARYLCRLCARERLNGIPDEAERCWNYTPVSYTHLDVYKRQLIALMKDQVDALAARGIPATMINSSLSLSLIHI